MKTINIKKEFKIFQSKWQAEYLLGCLIGDELFSVIFGYLPPDKLFEDLSRDELSFSWKCHLKYDARQ